MTKKDITSDSLPFGKFLQISAVLEKKNEDVLSKEVEIASIISGKSIDEVMDMSLGEVNALVDKARRGMQMEKPSLRDNYKINGYEYKLEKNVHSWSAGRFIDFSSVGKDGDKPHLLIAVTLTLKGTKYGDKDVQLLAEDIWNHMPAQEALQILDFFTKLSQTFLKITEVYLEEGQTAPGRKMKVNMKGLMAVTADILRGGDGSLASKELLK
jgi:hypothetical protein